MKKVLFLLFISTQFFGQDTIQISKKDLEARIEGQNLSLKLANDEVNIAKASLLESRAMYLPNVTASYTGISTNNPLMAFGSKLNQERITMMDFDPARLNSPDNIFNFATKLEFQQPIFNKDAVYRKKAGEVKVDVLKIKEERTKEYLQFDLNKAYLQLQMAYKVVKVLEEAKNTTLANKKVIDNYYKNGMIQKSEVLYMQVRVSEIESQIQYAKSNVRNASDYVYFLLNEDSENKVFKPLDEFSYEENILEQNPTLNRNRKDLQAYEKSLEAYDWMIKSSKAKFLPKLNAFGSFEVYDSKPYQFDANGYLVGLQLSWNVFDGLKAKSEQEKYKADLSKAQTEIQQYQKQNQLELNKSYRQVLDADKKVSLTKLSWEQSAEAYRIRKNRYDQGLEKSSDLLSAETQMSQKELEHQQAIFEYNSALEYFKFLK
ncbi:TolC family protein [Kaistella jeonii]|uniref:Transporter n=1 Tax=Kaistella jeonii TaxID=266749 RepID=A0A0C1FAE7_9FLAO|nr:TolC family protein [Kaistella jeonii]KIA88883.1 transporter [Kaistella jeonii]SFC12411.1 Outer membrane protein TolC [Kaistella jeonii]VEI94503.1 type I secretion outer membrane protein, TolC family [Kaistella jeonii]